MLRLPLMEDEPARRLAPAGNRVALWGGFRLLRPLLSLARSHRARDLSWKVNPPGIAGAASKTAERDNAAVRVRRFPRTNGRRAAGAAAGFEHPRRLPSREARHLRLPLATTQPVEGAALIRRYGSVRLRGGQLRRILREALRQTHAAGATGQRGRLLSERFRVRLPGGVLRRGSSEGQSGALIRRRPSVRT